MGNTVPGTLSPGKPAAAGQGRYDGVFRGEISDLSGKTGVIRVI
jgi:hypothetical protein